MKAEDITGNRLSNQHIGLHSTKSPEDVPPIKAPTVARSGQTQLPLQTLPLQKRRLKLLRAFDTDTIEEDGHSRMTSRATGSLDASTTQQNQQYCHCCSIFVTK